MSMPEQMNKTDGAIKQQINRPKEAASVDSERGSDGGSGGGGGGPSPGYGIEDEDCGGDDNAEEHNGEDDIVSANADNGAAAIDAKQEPADDEAEGDITVGDESEAGKGAGAPPLTERAALASLRVPKGSGQPTLPTLPTLGVNQTPALGSVLSPLGGAGASVSVSAGTLSLVSGGTAATATATAPAAGVALREEDLDEEARKLLKGKGQQQR